MTLAAGLASPILAVVMGITLGSFFFGGLWWTVKHLAVSKSPAVLVLTSLAIRMTVAIAGFYLLTASGWQSAAYAGAGFMLARTVCVRLLPVPLAKAEA